MKLRTIEKKSKSNFVNMGPIRLRQPLPSFQINDANPYLLLHHYGPFEINKDSNPFDLGPHPHRGFEPITFLIQGTQLHRDSLGNESLVKGGDVQWTTAGKGIIHAEGPDKAFVANGGKLEGIQLWLNLPKAKKMMDPAYQHVKSEDMPMLTSTDGKIDLKIVAGDFEGKTGKINTQSEISVLWGYAQSEGETTVAIPEDHTASLYLIKGAVTVNDTEHLTEDSIRMVTLAKDGAGISIATTKESEFIILTGKPIEEPVVAHGPFVMNTEGEIKQAMLDFHSGKMGHLAE